MDYDDERINRIYDLMAKIVMWAALIFFFGILALGIIKSL